MTADVHTAADIEDGELIDITLQLDRVDTPDEHDSIACWVHFVDPDGVFVKCTIFHDSAFSDFEWDAEYYDLTQVKGDIYQGTVGITPSWDTEIEALAEIPDAFTIADEEKPDDADAPDESQTGETDGRVALDIEVLTSVTEAELDLNDPTHIELLCIGVGYQPARGHPVETAVLFREGTDPQSEVELLDTLCAWLDERQAGTLLTFSGTGFDLPHLRDRAEIASEAAAAGHETPARVNETLDSFAHVDLRPIAKQAYANGYSLEGACQGASVPVVETHWDVYRHELSPPTWREAQWEEMYNSPEKPLDDPTVLGSDVPFFGDRYLERLETDPESVEARSLRMLLDRYTESDIAPLFSLAETDVFVANADL